jgi:itaconyl-CoA hydratase
VEVFPVELAADDDVAVRVSTAHLVDLDGFAVDVERRVVSDVYEHRPRRTITETHNNWFTLLTMNNHPLHFDAEYAAKSEFAWPLVNSSIAI